MANNFDLLREVGVMLYGDRRWMKQIATALGRDYRTLSRYKSGETPLTDDLWDASDFTHKLQKLLKQYEQDVHRRVQRVEKKIRQKNGG